MQPSTDFYGVRDYSLIILKSSAAGESLVATFRSQWKGVILSLFETDLSPLPIRRRLKSGLACALDGTLMKNKSNGGQVQCILYVLVVLRVAHHAADVVQQGHRLEDPTGRKRQAMGGLEAVEDLSG